MKIFILLPRIPFPLEKGDKLRAFNQIKYLSEYHEIHLCALNDAEIHPSAIEALKPYCKSINFFYLPPSDRIIGVFLSLFNGRPFQVGYFFNRRNYKKINQLINEIKPDRLYCQLVRVAEYIKHQKIKKTIDYQDVFSKGIERRIAHASFYMKLIFKMEYKRLVRYEAEVFDRFDNKVIISHPDKELIQHPQNNKIVVIPNGVDFEYYKPLEREKEYDLLFTGNMGYAPNINSVIYLVTKILPEVYKKIPKIKVLIAGANPSLKVLSLKSENINVTGWVKDMRECYAKAKIFIAPMQIGTGLQNKLLEAMAMKLPCITSELANSALCAVNGTEIITGNDPEDYASQIISLLNDAEKAKKLGENGYQFVLKKYNWKTNNEVLNKLICS
jgi:sugar transferase (PEP-CTERM/EpsH1 system associated)